MEEYQSEKKIEIGSDALGYLDTTRKWTMFFAVLGFIVIGLMIIGGFAAGALMKSLSGLSGVEGLEGMEGMEAAGAASGVAQVLFIVIMLVFAVIYFFPLFFLLKFSTHTSRAVKALDREELGKAFRYMKSYWLYIGVLVIIVLAIYLIIFLVAGSSLAFLSGLKG